MGCPSEVKLGGNLTFSICCHDPDTGVRTDADALPAYDVHEDDTDASMGSGTMLKYTDALGAAALGFYRETLACTAANGYQVDSTYTILIGATVDADPGGITYGFKVTGPVAKYVEL
jgi:hypothetical protein